MAQIGMFDDNLMQEQSTDWKWNMANDYPQKNGLTAFSCFACGGGEAQWVINLPELMFWVAARLTPK